MQWLALVDHAGSPGRSAARARTRDRQLTRPQRRALLESAPHGTARHSRNTCCIATLYRAAQIAQLGDGIVDVISDASELGAKLAAAGFTLAPIILHTRRIVMPS